MNNKIEINLLENVDPHKYYSHIYKAVKSSKFGISKEGSVIFGLELVIVSRGNETDGVEEEIQMMGTETLLTLPEEGIIENAYYENSTKCISTDWETGYCDDVETTLYRVL